MTDAPEPAPSAPLSRRRRLFRRRAVRIAAWASGGVFLLLVSVLLLLSPVIAPRVLRSIARAEGLDIRYSRLRVGLFRGDLSLRDVAVAPLHGSEPFLRMRAFHARVRPLSIFSARLRLSVLELEDAHAEIDRGPDGALVAVQRIASAREERPATAKKVPGERRREVAVESLTLDRAILHVCDESVSPRFEGDVEVRARASNLNTADGRPSVAEISVAAPPVLGLLRVSARGSENGAEVHLEIGELRPRAVASYLESLGMRPAADELACELDARFDRPEAGAGAGGLSIDRLRIAADGRETVAIDALGARGASGGWTALERVEVRRADVETARRADGTIVIGGVGLAPRPGRAVAPESSPPPRFSLASLDARRVRVTLHDEAVRPATDLALAIDALGLEGLDLRPEAPPARFHALVRVPGAIDALAVAGEVAPDASLPALALEVAARGIRSGPLAAYLPRFEVSDGTLRGALDARVTRALRGGRAARFEVADLDLREADARSPLLHLDALRAIVPRFDWAARAVEIDEVSVLGLGGAIARTEDGGMRVAGLALAPAKPVAATPTARVGEPEPEAPARHEEAPLAGVPASAGLPDVRLRDLHATVRGLAVGVPEHPVEIAELVLRNRGEIVLRGEDPPSSPPFDLELRAALPPLAARVVATATLAPFANAPAARVRIEAEGLNGKALRRVAPDLMKSLDPSAIEDGRFRVEVGMVLRAPRRGPAQLDLAKGLSADVSIDDLALGEGDAPPYLALRAAHADIARLDPAKGTMRVRRLDVDGPRVVVERVPEGVRVGGLLFPPQEKQPEAPEKPRAIAGAPKEGGPEIRFDKIRVSDGTLDYVDADAKPAVPLPIHDLDATITHLLLRPGIGQGALRFDASLSGGREAAPAAGPAGGAAAGVARPVRAAAGGRPWLGEAAVRGGIVIGERKTGDIQASLDRLDLAQLRDLAARHGTKLRAGVLDLELHAEILANGGLELWTNAAVAGLDVGGIGGRIAGALSGAAPRDDSVFEAPGERGGLRVPFHIQIPPKGASTREIVREAFAAIVRIATSPLPAGPRTAGGTMKRPLGLRFEPGTVALPRGAAAAVAKLGREAAHDETTVLTVRPLLGEGDVKRERGLANPPPAYVRDLAAGLLAREADLERRRADAVAAAHEALAAKDAGRWNDAIAAAERIQDELARTEAALDDAYDLLRDGEGGAGWRARDATLALAAARLEAVRAALVASGFPDDADRLRLGRPRFEARSGGEEGTVVITLARRRAP